MEIAMHLLLTSYILLACSSEIDTKPAAEVSNVPTKEIVQSIEKSNSVVKVVKTEKTGGDSFNKTLLVPPSKVEFIGAKVTSDHRGGFNGFKGSAQIEEGKFTAVNLIIDMTSLYADPFRGSKKFESHLKAEDFFFVDQYPTATFNSSKIEGSSVTGIFEMRGVQKEITFDATMTVSEDSFGLQTEFKINRKLWGVEYKGKPDNLIKDDVAIIANLTFASK